MKIFIEECSTPEIRQEIEALLELNDLPSLVRSWVTDRRDLCVVPGKDDTTGAKRVYLIFQIDGKDAGAAYLSDEEALKLYPQASNVIAPQYQSNGYEGIDTPEVKAFRKATEKLIGPEFDEELLSSVTDLNRGITATIGLALGFGDARFSEICPDFLIDSPPEEAERCCRDLLEVHCQRWNNEQRGCEVWNYYVKR